VQFFAVGTSGTDFNIASSVDTHTFNLPTASGTNRGALSSADWSMFNAKENAITAGTTAQYFRGDKTFQTLNTSVVPELTNLYYTEARVNANTNVAANTAARHNAVTLGSANGLSLSTQVLSLGLASAGVTGALSGTDWNTFNSKQNALTNPVTGTGTTNYLAKFTGTSTIGNSQVFDNGTNVGINQAIPTRTLDILGASGIGTVLKLQGASGTTTYLQLAYNGATNAQSGYIGYNSSSQLQFFTNDTLAMTLFSDGNTFIGSSPSNAGFRLDVNGTGRFSGVLTTNSGTNSTNGIQIISSLSSSLFTGGIEFIRTTVAGGSKVQPLRDAAIGGVGLSFLVTANNTAEVNATYTSALSILNTGAATFSSSVTAGSTIRMSNSAVNRAVIIGVDSASEPSIQAVVNNSDVSRQISINPSGGNVLIGTTTDAGYKLDVNGSVRITDGQYFIYDTRANASNRNWTLVSNAQVFGDFAIRQSNAKDGNPLTAGTDRFYITPGGNVLIGTTTDVGARLHVNGAVRTGAPSGGSAVDWLLGTARGGTITPNAIVRVEIGGVLVDLDARYV
jgi:hypothetical protein